MVAAVDSEVAVEAVVVAVDSEAVVEAVVVVVVHPVVVVVEVAAENRVVSKAEKLLLLNHIVTVNLNFNRFSCSRFNTD